MLIDFCSIISQSIIILSLRKGLSGVFQDLRRKQEKLYNEKQTDWIDNQQKN